MKKYIIGMIVVFTILMVGCAQVEDTSDAMEKDDAMVGEAPGTDGVQDKSTMKDDAMDDGDSVTAKITGAVVIGAEELLSDVSCAEDRMITVTFTNTGTGDVLVSDVDFIVNGQFDATPDCQASELRAGESTICSGLKALGAGRTSVVQVIMPDRAQGLQKVDCEKPPECTRDSDCRDTEQCEKDRCVVPE